MSDIFMLVDVFQTFWNYSLHKYQIDPAYFVSALQLAWNALFKTIDRPIPLISNPEMCQLIQPNIRRCIKHASVRDAVANNKLMGSLYDSLQPTSYIMEVNANNLYI